MWPVFLCPKHRRLHTMQYSVDDLAAELNLTWQQVLYRAYRCGALQPFTRAQADQIRVKPRRGKERQQTAEQKRAYYRRKQAERRANIKSDGTGEISENKS